jgi:peptide/nickel transport system permease protein
MRSLKYILRRLLYAIPTLLAISILTFALSRLAPGDPVRLFTFGAVDLTQSDIEALRHTYGLDRPYPEQYLDWLWSAVFFDVGRAPSIASQSILYHRPAAGLLFERLGNTLQLAIAALFLQLAIGVPLGVLAAFKRGSLIDKFVRVFAVGGHALPTFWLGLMLIYLVSVNLRLLPSQGLLTIGRDVWDIPDRIRHILMPAFVLSLAGIANYSRYLRTETLEVITQDFIRTARAKGLRERTVMVTHAFRNTLIPVVTALGGILAVLVSGALIVEQVFTWPGVGQFTYAAVRQKDYPIVMAGVMLASTLLVISYILRDIAYSIVDPRIKR